MVQLVLVDEDDNAIGEESKDVCHQKDGILHRAFSVFIFNDKKELLIQKRSRFKKLWASHWSNSCCSHPTKDETYLEAASRRMKEELGFSSKLTLLYKFRYSARYKSTGSENELCAVLVGKHNGEIRPDPKEVSEHKWISVKKLQKDMINNSKDYTPWFKMESRRIFSDYLSKI